VTELARPDIVALKPYEHATWEPSLERLHANELPWRTGADNSDAGLNRYPEPQPHALVEALANLYGVAPEYVLVGRGSDEAIDLLTRAFCRAGQDAVLVCPPTFGMYSVSARIQGADVITVPLRSDAAFAIDERALLERCLTERPGPISSSPACRASHGICHDCRTWQSFERCPKPTDWPGPGVGRSSRTRRSSRSCGR
jgi:histidinol-phosphate/aromatic aminotransferase/cobyric acid decarboxylase-like protein